MKSNAELAQIFREISEMLELTGADKFRVLAHERAARTIDDLGFEVIDIADDRDELMKIEGIGAKTADKIAEYAKTGKVKEHQDLRKEVPAGLLDVLRVPGLGPKTVKVMWDEANVESIGDLKRIIEDGSILKLPRMGAKTVQNIREAIGFMEQAGGRTPIGIGLPLAELIIERLRSVKGVKEIAYAGSLRRGKDTIGDIDILAATKDGDHLRKAFTTQEGVEKVLASGETKASVRLTGDARSVQVDLRIIDDHAFGAALLYFTGSKEHNVSLRERAIKMGYTLNEYGLFPIDQEKSAPQKRGIKPIAARTEEEIYKKLKLPYIPPELREDRGEVEDGFEVPDLITMDDIACELHAHTTASDGRLSIQELAEAAKARGFHTIAVTDHSKSSVQANGLDAKRLRAHIKAIRAEDAKIQGIRILAGAEVDILADGSLDYDDDLLAELDIVVASPHAALRQDPKKATDRLLRAVSHPMVHILGHPTGRLIGEREGMNPDIEELAAAAKEHNTALEINAHWRRLDLRDVHVRIAHEAGAKIAINCDVHSQDGFETLRYGVLTARRGALAKAACINSWSAAKLHNWLKSKRDR